MQGNTVFHISINAHPASISLAAYPSSQSQLYLQLPQVVYGTQGTTDGAVSYTSHVPTPGRALLCSSTSHAPTDGPLPSRPSISAIPSQQNVPTPSQFDKLQASPEIMGRIFEYTIASDESNPPSSFDTRSDMRWRFPLVCKEWNRIALQTSALWTSFLVQSTAIVTKGPLNKALMNGLILQMHRASAFIGTYSVIISGNHKTNAVLFFVRMLAITSQKWGSLTMSVCDRELLARIQGCLSNLHTLNVTSEDAQHYGAKKDAAAFSIAPNLQRVHVPNVSDLQPGGRFSGIELSRLKEFECRPESQSPDALKRASGSILACLDILRKAPALEGCALVCTSEKLLPSADRHVTHKSPLFRIPPRCQQQR